MLDMAEAGRQKILADRRDQKAPSMPELVEAVMRQEKIGGAKVLGELFRLCRGKKGLKPREYFAYQVYRKDLSMEQKREFVGEASSFLKNCELSPPELTRMRGFLRDKFAFGELCRHFGLSVAETQAVFTPDRFSGNIPALRNAADITRFLTQEARLPIFGKPLSGQQALGTVRIDKVDAETGKAQLNGGRVVAVSDLAAEIVQDFPDGYLLQTAVEQHPALCDIAGPALATARFVTVIEEDAPAVLYSVWKMAGPDAAADNFWQPGSMLTAVNKETGVVERCVPPSALQMVEIDTHPVSGKPIIGFEVPDYKQGIDLVRKAHSIFPVNGCLGWDVGFSKDGPGIIECNENPGHDFYQMATGQGALNPDIQAVFDRVIARSKRLMEDRRARRYLV